MSTIFAPTNQDSFTTNGEVKTITTVGLAYSNVGTPALTSDDHTGLTLINFGGIVNSGGGIGLVFTTDSTGSIFNELGGYISGAIGVYLSGTGVSLTNFGSISGYGASEGVGIGLSSGSQDNHIDNRGTIFGEHYGIRDQSNSGGNEIVNYGSIEGGDAAINIFTAPGKVTEITNYGTLSSGTFKAIDNHQTGAVHLVNYGTIDGDVSLESIEVLDVDYIFNYGTIDGLVQLGAGDDQFDGSKGAAVKVFGENGKDFLMGGQGMDLLSGGSGADRIVGKGGSDTLFGGAANDRFVFDSALKFAGVDTIDDFEHGVDKIELAHSIFAKTAANAADMLKGFMFFAGAAAHDADDRIIYNPNSGWLTYDKNGSAAGGAVHFATLDAHLTVTAADFLIG